MQKSRSGSSASAHSRLAKVRSSEGIVIERRKSVRPPCEAESASCTCGEGKDQATSIVRIDTCTTMTKWGQFCEPCNSVESTCGKLKHCAQCEQNNPHAICSACSLGRFGQHCEEKRPCKVPNTTEYASIYSYKTNDDVHTLEFQCLGGRVQQGARFLKCDADAGVWNHHPPRCVPPMMCTTLPEIPFSRIKFHSTESLVYTCAEGFVTSGPVLETAMRCENGAWVLVGERIKCENGPRCFSLPSFTGARPVAGTQYAASYRDGQTVQYECSPGFDQQPEREAPHNLTCVHGKWVGHVPECVLKGCAKFTAEGGEVNYTIPQTYISNDVNSSYLPIGTLAKVTCRDGFVLSEGSEVTCSAPDGQWLPAMCEAKCVQTSSRGGGSVCVINIVSPMVTAEGGVTQVYPGQTVTFGCKEGHFRKVGTGDAERFCFYNGTLSGSEIECGQPYPPLCKIDTANKENLKFCRGIGCTETGLDTSRPIVDYVVPAHYVSFPDDVEFSCAGGESWELRGLNKIQCLPDGNFSNSIPQCEITCGKRWPTMVRRLRGGVEKEIAEWPWQAALFRYHADRDQARKEVQFLCGAALVGLQWAITAAHCLMQGNTKQLIPVENLRLTYGLSSSNESRAEALQSVSSKYELKRVVAFKDYDPKTLNHDIALLMFDAPVQLGRPVGVVCMPESLDCSDQRLAKRRGGYATGWGVNEGHKESEELRELQLQVASNDDCNQEYKDEGYNGAEVFTDNMLCANSSSPAHDIGSGDSGGPFVVEGNSHYVLEGVVSWSKQGDQKDPPNESQSSRRGHGEETTPDKVPTCTGTCISGHTRVARYIDWIRRETGITADRGCL